MKYFKLLLAVFLLTVLPQLVKAEETLVPAAEDQPAASQASTPIEAGNKFCPVSGEKVGGMGEVVKYEHEGKIYNFCCPMCLKDFKKDPQKYIKILEEKGDLNNAAQAESSEHQDDHHHQDHDEK